MTTQRISRRTALQGSLAAAAVGVTSVLLSSPASATTVPGNSVALGAIPMYYGCSRKVVESRSDTNRSDMWGWYTQSVSHVQSALNRAGVHVSTDGSFGPATRSAVITFQRKHGLHADGIVGEQTVGKLGLYIASNLW